MSIKIEKIPIRSGQWNDIMNSCFYTIIQRIDDEFILCQDNFTKELFILKSYLED